MIRRVYACFFVALLGAPAHVVQGQIAGPGTSSGSQREPTAALIDRILTGDDVSGTWDALADALIAEPGSDLDLGRRRAGELAGALADSAVLRGPGEAAVGAGAFPLVARLRAFGRGAASTRWAGRWYIPAIAVGVLGLVALMILKGLALRRGSRSAPRATGSGRGRWVSTGARGLGRSARSRSQDAARLEARLRSRRAA